MAVRTAKKPTEAATPTRTSWLHFCRSTTACKVCNTPCGERQRYRVDAESAAGAFDAASCSGPTRVYIGRLRTQRQRGSIWTRPTPLRMQSRHAGLTQPSGRCETTVPRPAAAEALGTAAPLRAQRPKRPELCHQHVAKARHRIQLQLGFFALMIGWSSGDPPPVGPPSSSAPSIWSGTALPMALPRCPPAPARRKSVRGLTARRQRRRRRHL